ncbi:type IV secretion system DNA-binding domain-containing protein [Patescibacteria group bacterium]|nr:type IV secretion system DNA-binding domain-containing protein [Patescibacteria group bacterium]
MSIEYNHDHEREITLFGSVNFRNADRRFGIRTEDRRRHMYLIGKTGMGKSTLMENMFLSDVYAGHGCCYIDPHGDGAEKLIDFIPKERINDVVYFNPADTAYPFGFNILEVSGGDDRKHLIRDGLMGVFKKIWPDVWSARMEYVLINCVSALLDYPGATLMGVNRLLFDKDYRAKVVEKIRDPIVKTFWVAEYTSWDEKYAIEAGAPIQNKVGQFLSAGMIRNIVAQTRSTIDVRKIMDEGKILIANLSKGRIGEDGMRLLGGLLVTKIQLSAQERQNIQEKDRRDFYLYVDEFQNFANESFATILSEARKYRLNLIVTHQYMAQLEEEVQDAVLGNVGTMIVMRVGPQDAEMLETEFTPTFLPEDLVSLAKYQMYIKLMVDGVATTPFSANTLPPISQRTNSTENVVKVSRERYAEPRQVIEEKVLKWAGMEFVHLPTVVASTEEPAMAAPTVTDQSNTLDTDASRVSTTASAPSIPAEALPESRTLQTRENTSVSSGDLDELIHSHETGGVTQPTLVIRPERLSAIEETQKAAKAAAKMRKKPSFPHTCQRCGKEFTLAVQLDPSKPIYCQECHALVVQERANRTSPGAGRSTPPSARPRDAVPRRDGAGASVSRDRRPVREEARNRPLEPRGPMLVIPPRTQNAKTANVTPEERTSPDIKPPAMVQKPSTTSSLASSLPPAPSYAAKAAPDAPNEIPSTKGTLAPGERMRL